MTRAAAYSQAMEDILADPDRTLESAIIRGIRAGIDLERRRIAAILRAPEAAGRLELALWLALHEADIPDECAIGIMASAAPTGSADVIDIAARRAALKLILTRKPDGEKNQH